jgi:putative Holliday junction resolvase
MAKPQPLLKVEDLSATMPETGALMGLDLGTRTIGLAISDVRRRIATPLMVIRRTKFTADAAELMKQAAIHQPIALVLGLPVNMDGSEGPRVQATRAFARNLARLADLPIAFWDERLSTAAVTRTLLEADTSRKRRDAVVDKVAAAYILQGALDRLANLQARAASEGAGRTAS